MPLVDFFQQPEFEVLLPFLRPFEQTALEVDFGLLELFEVDMDSNDALNDDFFGELETPVKVDGAHQCLESIAAQRAETFARTVVGLVLDVVVETEFLRKLVERGAADDARAHFGEETLGLGREGMENVIAHDEVEDGIAEEFKSLVAQAKVAHNDFRLRLMGKSQLIQRDVAWIEPEDIVNVVGKCLVFG